MYYYACPYCEPCPKARLERAMVEDRECKYDKEENCKESHKCKEVMVCKKCKEQWVYSLKFLRDQKRKIKDG